MFAAIACHFNPVGYEAPARHYRRFKKEFSQWGIPLFDAVAVFEGQQPVVSDAYMVLAAGARNIAWQKERLYNLVAESLPAQYDKLLFFDADFNFVSDQWIEEAEEALKKHQAVQLFDRIWYADHNNQIGGAFSYSVGVRGERYRYPARFAHLRTTPGLAWAVHRDVSNWYDWHILGGGDSYALDAFLGTHRRRGIADWLPEKQRKHFWEWADQKFIKVAGYITNISGDVVHYYHGNRKNRAYRERYYIINKYDFDPERHIEIDGQGLWRWTEEAPEGMVQEIAAHFMSRQEDSP